MNFDVLEYSSAIGVLIVVARANVVHAIAFPERWPDHKRRLERHFPGATFAPVAALPRITRALDAYFAGDLGALERLEVEPSGTDFQRKVWRRLRSIPPGGTTSYGSIAREIGAPSASRAVGAANGANPISIVLPCHRVVGSSGDITGYAGGLDRKRWLLEHERRGTGG